MYKFLIPLSFTVFLTACETPPEAVEFPNNKAEVAANSQEFLKTPTGEVPKNPFDRGAWQYSMTTFGSKLNHHYHAQLWYLAQHADRIAIVGANHNIQAIQSAFLSAGTTPQINLTPICYGSKYVKCPQLVNLYFYKDAPVVQHKKTVQNIQPKERESTIYLQ